MKFFRNAMISFIVFFIILILVFCGLYYYTISPTGTSDKNITVEIPYGTSRDEIAAILKDKNLIRKTDTFRLYLKLNSITNLQAGTYNFSKSMGMKEIVNKLSTGDIIKVTTMITIKEGKNINQIGDLIASKTAYTKEEYLALISNKTYLTELVNKYWFLSTDIFNKQIYYPLEGYLFPETYDIYNLTLKQIIELQLNTTKKILDKYKTKIEASKYNVHELITLASIVELEGKTTESRAKIANALYNRLDKNIALGCDVTTYYAERKTFADDLAQSELDALNAYNTRNLNFIGLPVGPISNPGESAIKATLYPTTTNYLYFLADKNGTVYLFPTYTEFVAKKAELKAKGLWFIYD